MIMITWMLVILTLSQLVQHQGKHYQVILVISTQEFLGMCFPYSLVNWYKLVHHKYSINKNLVMKTYCQCHDLNFCFVTGAPSIRKFHVLRDRRHVITKDSEEKVTVWDILKVRIFIKNFFYGFSV